MAIIVTNIKRKNMTSFLRTEGFLNTISTGLQSVINYNIMVEKTQKSIG